MTKSLQIVPLAREHGQVAMRDAIKFTAAQRYPSRILGRWSRKVAFASREKRLAPGMNCVEAA